jgi:hypothetical protein
MKSNLGTAMSAPKRKNLPDLASQEPPTGLLSPRNLSQRNVITEGQSIDKYDLILEYLMVGLNYMDHDSHQ